MEVDWSEQTRSKTNGKNEAAKERFALQGDPEIWYKNLVEVYGPFLNPLVPVVPTGSASRVPENIFATSL
jgi:hypothetical protein